MHAILSQLISLISDLGGQTGLWLGLSMIAVFELVELIVDVCVLAVRKCKRKNRVGRSKGGNWA